MASSPRQRQEALASGQALREEAPQIPDSAGAAKSSDILLSLRGLGKAYRVYAEPLDRLKDLVGRGPPSRGEAFWALRDLNLELRRGEALGIVGRNGSGKSTLLQMICGTLQPTTGRVRVNGRLAALLELGAGFNPDFTGRENVFLNAAVLGLTEAQIAERFEAIAAFAGIGAFMDRPVQHYSSGMYARLAFAVCAHVDAEILIVDEILAVGDIAFQQKCMRFLRGFRERGTLLFVSHDEAAVLALCESALWLEGGVMRACGPAKEVCRRYATALAATALAQGAEPDGAFRTGGGEEGLAGAGEAIRPGEQESLAGREETSGSVSALSKTAEPAPPLRPLVRDEGEDEGKDGWAKPLPPLVRDERWRGLNPIEIFDFDPDAPWHGHGGALIEGAGFFTPDDQPLSPAQAGEAVPRVSDRPLTLAQGGEEVELRIWGRAERAVERPIVGFILRNRLGQNLFGDNTYLTYRTSPRSLAPNQTFHAAFRFQMPYLPTGDYFLAPSIIEGTQADHIHLYWMEEAVRLRVHRSPIRRGEVGVPMLEIHLG